MEQGKGRDTLRSMATNKNESSSLGKEKRVTCPSKPNASVTTHGAASQGLRRPTIASLQGQEQRRVSLPATLPTHINKSTRSICSDDFTKTAKKIGVVNSSTKSQPQRPASAAPIRKPLVSSAPLKPTTPPTARAAASFSSKVTATAPKPTLERLANNPIAGKPSTLSSCSSRSRTRTMTMTMTKSLKKAPTTTTKRGTTTSLASKKPPLTKKDVQKENLDHQVEEVVKDEVGEVHDVEIPKAEETQQHDDQVEVLAATHHVKSVEEEKEKDTLDDVPTFVEQHEIPQLEEMEEHDGDKENDSKEEVNDSDGDKEEEVQNEETKVEAENGGVEEGYRAEEVTENGEEKGDHEGKEQELELVKEETIVEEANVVTATSQVQEEALHGEKETIEEEANVVIATNQVQEEALHGEKETIEEEANVVIATNQVQEEAMHGKKEMAAPIISDMVVEEKASNNKVIDRRKNSVRALIGAFETHN